MLLSLYASFRWAGKENYVLKMSAFIVLMSLLSSFMVWYILGALSPLVNPISFILLPLLLALPFVSFPFYALWDENRIILPPPYMYSQRLTGYELRFLTTTIFSLVPQGPAAWASGGGGGWVDVVSYRVIFLTMEIGSIPSGTIYLLTMLFLFLIVVNVIGALFGFGISKIRMVRKIESEWVGFVGRVALEVAVLGAGIWLSTIGKVVKTSPADAYYYSYNPYPYAFDAFAFTIFSIVWLAIIIGEFALNR